MTAATTDTVDQPAPAVTNTDDLFHIAVDEVHNDRADTGREWLTYCGQWRKPAKAKHSVLTRRPGNCLVCTELFWAERGIA